VPERALVAHKFAFEGARVLLAGLPGDPVGDVAGTIRGRGGLPKRIAAIFPKNFMRKSA
jgi:hypothetical protein